jgi:hypothetical protein
MTTLAEAIAELMLCYPTEGKQRGIKIIRQLQKQVEVAREALESSLALAGTDSPLWDQVREALAQLSPDQELEM